jgi:hypothetical protein
MTELAHVMKESDDPEVKVAGAALCVVVTAVQNEKTRELAQQLLIHLVTGSKEELDRAAGIGGSIIDTPMQTSHRKN